jgi:hypothetical protein
MASPRLALLRLLLPAALLILGCPAPQPPPETIALEGLGRTIEPGRELSFLVHFDPQGVARDAGGQTVRVDLIDGSGAREELFRGETDANGFAPVTVRAPDDLDGPEATLTVDVDGPSGLAQVARSLRVGPAHDLILTTDKPIYQPGQMLHMRVLALERFGLAPAAESAVEVAVRDPNGNLLLKREATTSSFGVAAVDFPLDASGAQGIYRLTATLGESSFETTVEVKPYVLPRFEVTFEPAQSSYLPGDVVTGTVEAAYFFGKPVADAAVRLTAFTTDVERAEALSLEGITDAEGRWPFTFTMPSAFVVLPDGDETGSAGNRTATLDLELAVTDGAGHTERTEESLTVAESPILIEISPESGDLVAGVPNRLYISTTDPAGDGLATELTVSGDLLAEPLSATTDATGLAVVQVTPSDERQAVRLTVEAAAGELQGARTQAFWSTPGLLLRTDRTEYAPGDTVLVDIAVPAAWVTGERASTVYLIVEKAGESLAVQALPVSSAMAQAAVVLDERSVGTLLLRAVSADAPNTTSRDERLILVNVPPAEIAVTADADEYRPGDRATLSVQVESEGAPLPSALGISIVDESVFALGESDPGFVRSYFLLARELQQPRFGIEGFSEVRTGDPSPYDSVGQSALLDARDRALAGAFGQALATGTPGEGSQAAPSATAQRLWEYAGRLPLALPLIGLAFYDGTRRRRRLLAGLLTAAVAAWVLVACAAPAAPAAPASEAAAEAAAPAMLAGETTATRGVALPTRLRQFFPETLFWLPELTTDANGAAHFDLPIADSITTWRVSIVASDRDGRLGATTFDLPVFQPFFIEPDLPTHFTVGDEVAIPVAIYNYLDAPQLITVELAPAEGVELTGPSLLSVTVAANEVTSVAMPVRFAAFGEQTLRFDAVATAVESPDDPSTDNPSTDDPSTEDRSADAVERVVRVAPAGQQQASSQALHFGAESRAETMLLVPESVNPGASSVTVAVFPGSLATAVTGLEALLQEPHGCFEQVTSITYVDALVLEYLERTGQDDVVAFERMRQSLARGLQQQLGYEVQGWPGGFSYYGDAPPLPQLSAYGLMSFAAMARLTWVDPAILDRTASYLISQQAPDGAWYNNGLGSQWGISPFSMTALTVWALSEAGYADTLEVQRGVEYLLAQGAGGAAGVPLLDDQRAAPPPLPPPPSPLVIGGSTQGQPAPGRPTLVAPVSPTATLFPPTVTPAWPATDGSSWTPPPPSTYEYALAANALLAAGADASPFIEELLAQIETERAGEGGLLVSAGGHSWVGSMGYSADLEASALTVLALQRANVRPDLAADGLAGLVSLRDPWGTFGSTQGTLYTLMALLEATQPGEAGETTLTFTLGYETRTVFLPAGAEEMQRVRFDGVEPGAVLLVAEREGEQQPSVQVVTEAWTPWPDTGTANPALEVTLSYDRASLAVDETVGAGAVVRYRGPEMANMLLVQLPVPPGFDLLREDVRALEALDAVNRVDVRPDRMDLYLSNVAPGTVVELDYRLRARMVVDVESGAATVFDFYTPTVRNEAPPQRIVVTLND